MVAAKGDDDVWCAAVAAVDGAVELRVSPPARRDRDRVTTLGFVPVIDAWSRPATTASDEECARLLAEALGAAAPLRHVLTHPGVPGTVVTPPDAEHAEHVAGAVRALALHGRGRVYVGGGRPEQLYGTVCIDDGDLLVEREVAGETEVAGDIWREPFTLDGAAAAARTFVERTRAERPGFDAEPLFIGFIDP